MQSTNLDFGKLKDLKLGRLGVAYPATGEAAAVFFIAGGIDASDPMRWSVLLRQDGNPDEKLVPYALDNAHYNGALTVDLSDRFEVHYDVDALLEAKPVAALFERDMAGCIILASGQQLIGFRDLRGGGGQYVTMIANLQTGRIIDPELIRSLQGVVIRRWSIRSKSTDKLVESETLVKFNIPLKSQ